jgi:DNA-nicking Smr family endonuclease
MKDMEENFDTAEPVELSIDGTLDLHTFNPREVKELLPHYLDTCRGKGIYEVRIIHGKGTGMLRETVHSILRQLPGILSFGLADENAGGWGATIVLLKSISSQHVTVEENS